jgi:hypothetical protein
MRRIPLTLLLLLTLSPVAAWSADAAGTFAPVTGSVCRRIVDPLTVKGLVAVSPSLPGASCRLGRPVLLCEPGTLPLPFPTAAPEPTTTTVPPPPPLGRSICYRLACKGATSEQSSVSDPFGEPSVAAGAPALFCTAVHSAPPACETDADCASGSFCQSPKGQCGAAGTCTPRNVLCPQLYAPVCGCDGTTYPNACHATQAGVSIVHLGACEGDPTCPVPRDPVCGDDGISYPSPCLAAQADATVAHTGVCR